jgi:hypothetical protein
LTSLTIIFFTRIAPRTKSKGAPDQHSTHLLLLLTHASPRIKSKELHRYVLQIYYFINQVFKSFCSSAGIIKQKKIFFLNSRATGPKSTRGLGHQRPSRPGSHGTRLARRGPAAYSRGPQASEAGPGAAPARRLEHARLARHLAVRAQRSTVARPVASAQWPDDEKVFPHDIVAIPHTGPARKYRWQGIGAGRRRGGRSHRCAVAVLGGFGVRGNQPRFGKLFRGGWVLRDLRKRTKGV